MGREKIWDDLLALSIKFRGKFGTNITRNTSLSNDLGLDGDEAEEFLIAYSNKLEVDMTEFNFNEYFAIEGFSPWGFLIQLIKQKKYKNLTFGDLENAAVDGRWNKK